MTTREANLLGNVSLHVAIDDEGHRRDVPPLAPETDDEVRRVREAEIRRAHRLARKQEIEAGRAPMVGD